jgi:hypothetical protein
MDSVELYKLKTDPRCMFLDDDVISNIVGFFSKSNIKINKTPVKQVNIMKTNKIQAKKNQLENKLIMIMNKISDNNMVELLKEYIMNIFIDDDKFDIVQTELFNKMLKDVKFIEYYVKFSIMIFTVEYKRNNYQPKIFIGLLEQNINDDNENIRTACYSIIKHLQKNNFFNDNIIDNISNKLFESEKYLDIYYWFEGLNTDKYIDNIKDVIKKCENLGLTREKILIESLIETNVKPTIVVPVENNVSTPIINILDEYLFIKSLDEVSEYIINECKDIDSKNVFCNEIYKYYANNINDELFELIEKLLKNKVLFKSNLSKGLLIYVNENSADEEIIKNILKFLKKNNITKNIECLFKKYKIKIFYNE